MSVFRMEKIKDFTTMNNHHLKNKNLSLKAKGLLSLMLSLPDEWDYTVRGLASICKDGVDSISTAIKELEAEGYLIRERVRHEDGSFGKTEYIIHEQPVHYESKSDPLETQKTQNDKSVPVMPIQVNPIQDFPVQAKHAQLNTNISSTYKSSTDTTKEKKQLNARVREEQISKQIRIYRDMIERNIGYEALVTKYGFDRVDKIMELIMEAFYSISNDYYIGQKKYSKEDVRSKFLKLTSEQMEKVFDQIDHTTKKVKNPKAYVLTLLYNADIIDSFIAKREKDVAEEKSAHLQEKDNTAETVA